MTIKHSPSRQIIPELEPFVNEFITDRLTELKSLKNASKDNKFNDIKSLTHKWKAFFEAYGFGEILPEVLQLEKASLINDIELCDNLLIDIETFFSSLNR